MEIRIEVHERRPVSGRVSADGRSPAGFAGWLDLLALLERLLEEELETAPGVLGDKLGAGGDSQLPQRARDVCPDRAAGQ